jgi:acetyl esterase
MTSTLSERAQGRFVRALMALPDGLVRRLAGAPQRNTSGAVLDARVQLLARLQRLAATPYHAGTVERARETYERELRAGILGVTPSAEVTRRELSVDGGAGALRAYAYAPRRAAGALPGLVYLHGGGFVIGHIDAYDSGCRAIAEQAGIVVVSIDYRLAPEHRFPAASDDALAAFRWVAAHAAELGIDPARLAIGGDSAGGNLSAVTCLRARDEGGPRPCFAWLIYPATDMTRALRSHREHAAGPFIEERTTSWFLEHYLPPGADKKTPHASPLFAASHGALPPAHIVVAGFDPLRDEGLAYAEELRAAGVPVTVQHAATLAHGFFAMANLVPAARAAEAEAIEALRGALQA